MNLKDEWVFRVVFGVLWLLFFGVRIYFQRKVKVEGGYTHVNQRQEKLFFNLFALGYLLLFLYFLTPWIDFAHFTLPAWLRWVGAVITFGGIVFFGWAHQALGNNWTAILALSDGQQLVTSGPYRWVRHPMYTGFIIIGTGFVLLSANWLVAILYLGSMLTMFFVRVSTEEKMMVDRFGDAYREYIKKTGRLLPRLW